MLEDAQFLYIDVVQLVANTGCGWNGRGKRGAFYKQTTAFDCEQHPGSVHITVPPTPFTSCSVVCNHWHRSCNDSEQGVSKQPHTLKVYAEARSPFKCAMRMHAPGQRFAHAPQSWKHNSMLWLIATLRPKGA